jgi:hypothetical protein
VPYGGKQCSDTVDATKTNAAREFGQETGGGERKQGKYCTKNTARTTHTARTSTTATAPTAAAAAAATAEFSDMAAATTRRNTAK